MLIFSLFALAAAQDDKTNFLRLWSTTAGLPDGTLLLLEIHSKYKQQLLQALNELGPNAKTDPFKDLEEAAACIVAKGNGRDQIKN